MEKFSKFETYLEGKCKKACDQIDKFVLIELAKKSLQKPRLDLEDISAIFCDSKQSCGELFLADLTNIVEVSNASGSFSELSQDLVQRLKDKFSKQIFDCGNLKWAKIVFKLREEDGNFNKKAVYEMVSGGKI